jgi:hypothetical protein
MSKKQLIALINGLILNVMNNDSDLSEDEARTLVGVSLRVFSDRIITKCNDFTLNELSIARDFEITDLEDEAIALYEAGTETNDRNAERFQTPGTDKQKAMAELMTLAIHTERNKD